VVAVDWLSDWPSLRPSNLMAAYEPLRGDRDFTAVFRNGRRRDGDLLTVRALNTGNPTRLGFNIGKRHGHAVKRNNVRRRLRHILVNLDPEPGWDLVLVANSRTGSATYSELKSEAESLLRAVGVPLIGIDSSQ
jgi:ribonuclease P protein component